MTVEKVGEDMMAIELVVFGSARLRLDAFHIIAEGEAALPGTRRSPMVITVMFANPPLAEASLFGCILASLIAFWI